MCQIPKLLGWDILVVVKSTQRSQNQCLALIITKVLVYRLNLMRQGGYCISTFVLHVLQPLAVHFHIRKLIAKIKINNCQKRVGMDGHKLRSIHGARCFFTRDIAIDKITSQLKATRPVWKAWLARANAFKNVDPSRSYASVLQQSISSTVDKYVEIVDNGAVTETVRNFTKDTFQNKPITTKNSSYLATAKNICLQPLMTS